MNQWTQTNWLFFCIGVFLVAPIMSKVFFIYLGMYLRKRQADRFVKGMEERQRKYEEQKRSFNESMGEEPEE